MSHIYSLQTNTFSTPENFIIHLRLQHKRRTDTTPLRRKCKKAAGEKIKFANTNTRPRTGAYKQRFGH